MALRLPRWEVKFRDAREPDAAPEILVIENKTLVGAMKAAREILINRKDDIPYKILSVESAPLNSAYTEPFSAAHEVLPPVDVEMGDSA